MVLLQIETQPNYPTIMNEVLNFGHRNGQWTRNQESWTISLTCCVTLSKSLIGTVSILPTDSMVSKL